MPADPKTPDIFKKKPRKIRNTKPWTGMSPTAKQAEFDQAEKVVAKLGGPRMAASMLGIHFATVYRWMDPDFSNGIIPPQPAARIKRLARQQGILLTADDWAPNPNPRIIRMEEDAE